MNQPHNPLPFKIEGTDLNPNMYSHMIVAANEGVVADIPYDNKKDSNTPIGANIDAEYIVEACNNYPTAMDFLDQIVEDLADLQRNPNDLAHDVLMLFYDRMCANVTDIEEFKSKLK
jgi:hypothetical protein